MRALMRSLVRRRSVQTAPRSCLLPAAAAARSLFDCKRSATLSIATISIRSMGCSFKLQIQKKKSSRKTFTGWPMLTPGKSSPHKQNVRMPKTLFEKIWDRHVIRTLTSEAKGANEDPNSVGVRNSGGPSVLYIDRHFIHEVTSPPAFKGRER